MNSLVPYELAGQGVLLCILLLNWLFSFSSLKFFVLFVMGTHFAVQSMRYASKRLALHVCFASSLQPYDMHKRPRFWVISVRVTHRYSDKKMVDPSRIWDRTHKNDVQRQVIIGLAFGGVAFFCLLYNLVRE